jgi:hypothetical protein
MYTMESIISHFKGNSHTTAEYDISILKPCFKKEGNMNVITPRILSHFGYSIPSEEILSIFRRHIHPCATILEIGCGLGLYARIFAKIYPNWIATDHPQKYAEWIDRKPPFIMPIIYVEDPLSSFDTPPDVLITIWPEPNSTYFMDYVDRFQGELIIMIGCPGVTGADEMWELFDMEFDRIEYQAVCERVFMGFRDTETVAVWRKKRGQCTIANREEWDHVKKSHQ